MALFNSLKLFIFLTLFNRYYGQLIYWNRIDNISYRLPKHIIPLSYDLQLTSYLNEIHNENRNFTFDGNIKIDIKNTKNDNNEIILHARSLIINDDDISITDKDGNKLKFEKDYNKLNQFLTLTLTETKLKENDNYVIQIKYQGYIGSKFLNGYYRSRYTDSDDDYVAATQFSANAARKAFPCFDEPGIKATFKLTMNHHKNYVALSNMPFIETRQADDESDRKITTFDTTNVKMSTFVVAFALINYNLTPKNGVRQTIYVPEFLQKYTKFSLDHATKSLDFMEKYTNIKYKLPKLDHLAVPKFGAGAMENWGLIEYKPSKLIYNPEQNTASDKQDVARVISHEISHQWFGNLVTPEWWDYIWLSEGFATYMEYFVIDKIIPEWRMMDQFVVNVQQQIMLYDVKDISHPIDVHVENPDVWSADLIVYHKGGSILRMISYIIGEENLKKGLQTYLQELAEDVTNNDKLWKYLQTVSPEDIDVAKIGNTWIKNTGFPVVNIVRKYAENQYTLTQKPFIFLQDVKKELWSIPIRIVTKSNLDFTNLSPTHIMDEKELSINTKSRNESDRVVDPKNWYILNPEQTGYYRVNYDLVNWQSITEYLNSPEYDKIPPATRAQLIDDSLHLAEAGELGFDVALSLTKYLELETDIIPWTAAVSALQRVHINAMQSDYDTYYKTHIKTISEAMYEKLANNFEKTDEHLINLGRTKILQKLCNVGFQQCIENSESILINNILQNKEDIDIPIDLQGVIYCNGIKNANETIWQKLYDEKYIDNSNEIERNQIAFGLGCSLDQKILEKYLSMLLESKMKTNDLTTGFEGILTNLPIGVSVSLDFLEQNIEEIRGTIHDTSLVTILEKFAEHLVTPEEVKRFKDALDKLENRKFLLDGAIKIANDNLKWHEKHNEELKDWFTKTVIIPTTSTDNPPETSPGEETPTTKDPSSAKSYYISLLLLFPSTIIVFLRSFL